MSCFFQLFLGLSLVNHVSAYLCSPPAGYQYITTEYLDENMNVISPFLDVIESIATDHDRDTCLEKLFCVLESYIPANVHNPLKYVGDVFTNSKGKMDPKAFQRLKEHVKKHPNLARVVAAIELGQLEKESKACDSHFPECNVTVSFLARAINIFDNSNLSQNVSARVRRNVGCGVSAGVCGAVGVGCVLCGIFSFGACLAACGPATGAACVGVGVAC